MTTFKVFLGVLWCGWAMASAQQQAVMPAAQQNALVQKYCAVCHTDAARNGGLTLQHFDAAHVAPSLAAMMASKLTPGASFERAKAAASDPAAAAEMNQRMRGGAMNAAGLGMPDKATIDALIHALASQAEGATAWHVERSGASIAASILRQQTFATNPGETRMYRLSLACNADNHAGEIQLAWAPAPQRGTFLVTSDGETPVTYRVEGSEKMGNGTSAVTGPAAFDLKMPLPAKTLRIADLFPSETVEFPFADLPSDARKSLNACFAQQSSANIQLH